ncbi:DUF3299 domain-containing protein [Glaciecola sp. KUL10]|uniref:DUF3299 domain-containing protein n=1 Tax=Glaciecola sp. (strain KUL10) TaxID=2161813 RepID=UPI000D783B32|nr:DUF3299 domain-containing protein [Glaciecola sp. KUL10]GBL03185.1 hypothetical protein KUL10_04660 [Glaciecola sp. KUL10]
MKRGIKLSISFIVCILLGCSLGYVLFKYQHDLKQWSLFSSILYQTSDIQLIEQYESQDPVRLQWSQLLPFDEKSILQKYQQKQASTATEFADNILLSIQASTDKAYSDAMISTNAVESFDEQAVSIAGFIVPIDYYEAQNVQSMFLVPYFGACLHFPPPPPNQIIFAQLEQGFDELDITKAYLLKGVLRRGLFEDPLGTSAYMLDVISIEAYYEDPDDFRQH